ncbi:alpha/beta hydrolase [Pseudactinotalea sp.]|uniref:alpha/beta hydrolase n=1 Tax=Pseudactinotalea sp. TaxID=1926260 RepID=UPI003B3A1432
MSDVHPHLRALADGEIDLDTFASLLQRDGTPLIERGASGRAHVTFVHVQQEPLDGVTLVEQVSWLPPEQRQLVKIPGTPVWHLRWDLPADLRFSYHVDLRPGGPVGDPTNAHPPSRDSRLRRPVAVLPEAERLPWLDRALAPPPVGILHARTFTSAILGNERPVWVSTPAGWSPDGGPYPVAVVLDGEEGHLAPSVRDQLLAASEIPALVVVLVDEIGLRNQEMTANPDFSRALATELLPWLRKDFALTAHPAETILSGSSFGGLCAGWTALHHPETFGCALMQSPSCWWHPSTATPVRTGEPASVPTLIDAFRQNPPAPIRIYQECGNLENGPPPARVWQVFGNRWLHDVLDLKGYDARYREFAGGHDAAWWRGTWAEGIRWLLAP